MGYSCHQVCKKVTFGIFLPTFYGDSSLVMLGENVINIIIHLKFLFAFLSLLHTKRFDFCLPFLKDKSNNNKMLKSESLTITDRKTHRGRVAG